jgi:hypothetical protein
MYPVDGLNTSWKAVAWAAGQLVLPNGPLVKVVLVGTTSCGVWRGASLTGGGGGGGGGDGWAVKGAGRFTWMV